MAKKYHIDLNGEVVECRAKFRACPRTDYSTIEAATTARYLQEAAQDLEAARENVKRVFSDPNTKRTLTIADFSTRPMRNNSPRDYADQLEREFFADGKYPDLYSMRSELKPTNINSGEKRQKIFFHSTAAPDYDDGKIINHSSIVVLPKTASITDKGTSYELDFANDFEGSLVQAEDLIRETVIANATADDSYETIQEQTEILTKQLVNAYTTISEEIEGPNEVWKRAEGYGTFAKSDIDKLVVNVDYQNSTFRGKTFDRFLHENEYYEARSPEFDVRVYDNESRRSPNAWGIRYAKGQWYVETRIGRDIRNTPVNSPDEAYGMINEYIKTNMKSNDEETAAKKATYAADLMTDVNNSIRKFFNDKEAAAIQERKALEERRSQQSLYGKNNTGTMRDILNMFN